MAEPGKEPASGQAGTPITPADPSQGERLHTFAHDVKNRIGGLWAALHALRELPEGPERDDLLALAERNYFGAQRQVESLLDDLGVERGITLRSTGPIDLVSCVASAAANEEFRLSKKKQSVNISGDASVTVTGDAHWFTQLFQALISNASKFSSTGSVIDVVITRGTDEAVVRVIDHGVGLAAKDLDDLFTRYALLSSRSTAGEPQARGTLGRAKQWAEAHGGSVSASSGGEGKGTTFEVRLPMGDR